MLVLKLLPVILSLLLLGAHLLRAGLPVLAVVAALLPLILFVRQVWVARLIQFILMLGALEWVRVLLLRVAERRQLDQPWERLALILGVVAVFTMASALVFTKSGAVRRRYRLGET